MQYIAEASVRVAKSLWTPRHATLETRRNTTKRCKISLRQAYELRRKTTKRCNTSLGCARCLPFAAIRRRIVATVRRPSRSELFPVVRVHPRRLGRRSLRRTLRRSLRRRLRLRHHRREALRRPRLGPPRRRRRRSSIIAPTPRLPMMLTPVRRAARGVAAATFAVGAAAKVRQCLGVHPPVRLRAAIRGPGKDGPPKNM